VFRYLFRQATDVQDLAKVQVGKKTGKLERSIVKRVGRIDGDLEILVGSELSYALIHHNGTRPHQIVARPGHPLTFYWPKAGRVVTFRKVNHPGTRPNPYLADPLRTVMGH
jgi:hypothetical protein